MQVNWRFSERKDAVLALVSVAYPLPTIPRLHLIFGHVNRVLAGSGTLFQEGFAVPFATYLECWRMISPVIREPYRCYISPRHLRFDEVGNNKALDLLLNSNSYVGVSSTTSVDISANVISRCSCSTVSSVVSNHWQALVLQWDLLEVGWVFRESFRRQVVDSLSKDDGLRFTLYVHGYYIVLTLTPFVGMRCTDLPQGLALMTEINHY